MENEKLKKLSLELCCNKENYMQSFRKNVDMYVAQKDITLREIAEKADISFDTLKNFLYKDNSDCKLSTAVKLSRALNVSIDELVGCETISALTRESIALSRNLPENDLYLVRWFIRYLSEQNKKKPILDYPLSVMQLEQNHNWDLQMTSDYKKIDISGVEEPIRSKVFFGITVPCDYYMPLYGPFDILLIANDRDPKPCDHSLVRIGKFLFIVKIQDGKCYSIRDNRYRTDVSYLDEVIGYVAKKITPGHKPYSLVVH